MRITGAALLGAALWALSATGASALPPAGCDAVASVAVRGADGVSCVASSDLTTNNEATTPADNSLVGVPPLAFTPRTDRQAISPDAPERPAPVKAVPGLQVTGTFPGDDQARFVLRLPDDWNGRLVTGVPSSTRSEYGLDYAWSDYVLQRGYAYVASNKGALNVRPTTPADSKGCALSAPGGTQSGVFVRAYLLEPENSVAEWSTRTIQAARLGKRLAAARYGQSPKRNYVVGVSAGGWTIRNLLEQRADEFDGGIDWEGVLHSSRSNLLIDYPVALREWPAYRQSLFNEDSDAYRAMLDQGFAPEMKVGPNPNNAASPVFGSYLETHANAYWNLFMCLIQKELDPTYSGDYAAYDYRARDEALGLTERNADVEMSGHIDRKLITVAGTMDNITLMKTMRIYRELVARSGRASLHRLYEVQNGGHVDRQKQSSAGFTDLEFVQPHAQAAFDRLVRWVERGVRAPLSQCIPRGGAVVEKPRPAGRPKRCARLLER